MKHLLLSLVLLPILALAIDADPEFADAVLQSRYEHITHEVRCLVCQNQTLADSTAPLAADLRREIHDLVEQGKSDAEIEDFLVARYGDFVLYSPRFQSWTALLWLAPPLLMLIGVMTFVRIARKRARMPLDRDEPMQDQRS